MVYQKTFIYLYSERSYTRMSEWETWGLIGWNQFELCFHVCSMKNIHIRLDTEVWLMFNYFCSFSQKSKLNPYKTVIKWIWFWSLIPITRKIWTRMGNNWSKIFRSRVQRVRFYSSKEIVKFINDGLNTRRFPDIFFKILVPCIW